MPARRFPPPRWPRSFCRLAIIGDRLRSTNQLMQAEMSTDKDQAQRIAARIAKLPEVLTGRQRRSPQGRSDTETH
jgi:hypothetical protein